MTPILKLSEYHAFRCISLTILMLVVNSQRLAAENDAATLLQRAVTHLYADPKEASALANRALKLCDMSKPDSVCREASILYANAEQLLGNFDLSIKTLFDAEQMTDSTDLHTFARIFVLQGRVFSKLGDYARANKLNDRATAIFKSLGDSAWVAKCYTERGVTLLNTDEFILAEHFFRKSLDISRKLKNLEAIARNLNNMCLYPGDSDEKLKIIEEAITINKHLDSKWALGENYNNKGKQLCYANKPREALAALEIANRYIDEIGARELLCDNYEYTAMANAAAGNFKAAYENMEKMTVLVSELQRHNSQRNTDLDITRKRFEDQKLAAEKQEKDYEIRILHRNLWILIGGVMMIAVCCLFYYLWYKHKKNLELIQANQDLHLAEKEVDSLKMRQQQLELENTQNLLSASRQELTGFAAFLKSRNEMMEKIRDMLKEGYKLPHDEMVPHLKKISAFISSYASHDDTSKTLLLKAEELNKDFMNNLLQKHPNLTKGERNLALLIRGGMSTKEISMLLGLETKTINMNRYRLRKALGIPQDADLHDYLTSL
ncbi:LuxR family transcriptional regulator [Muribaculaceae bacterium Isolate-037 (Harlan)]|jgi:tetratricopeptide (TPR) repeat protein|nr:LuxR family transcriptional regulator [Muribaculaceae bacterium Isolate-037 (Harlan)]